jgi:uncharacterized RDD family membrane protein YckC
MTNPSAPPGWYPDPGNPGAQRYFDGTNWTHHQLLPVAHYSPYAPWGRPPWKGAQLGRPPNGPGALAEPARRLGARLLDALVLLPVLGILVAIAVVLIAPHAGPIFPRVHPNASGTQPVPGFVWIELGVLGASVATGLVLVAYETIATARYGRTLGKAWLGIRPLRTNGNHLGWGRAFGRVAIYWLAGALNWVGALDPLWCLWDENRQCLHDKVVDTVVINDFAEGQTWELSAEGPLVAPEAPDAPWGASQAWPSYGFSPAPPRPRNNGFAIASLVCSIVGVILAGVPSIAGVILGFVGRSQIRRSQGSQRGAGLALAGIIVGCCVIVLWVSIFLSAALTDHTNTGVLAAI